MSRRTGLVPARWRRPATALLVAALALPACTDGADGEPAGPAAPVTTTTVPALHDVRAVDVTGALAAGGFSLRVTAARMGLDRRDAPLVEVDLEITNVGPEPAPFTSPLRLAAPGRRAVTPTSLPDEAIPPGETVVVAARFPVDPTYPVDRARLVAGPDGQNQAVLPFTGEGAVSRVPIGLPGGVQVQAGHLTLVLQGGTIRWDDPINHEMLTEGRALVVLRFDAVRGVGGSPNLTSSNLRLRLADGTQLPTRADGHSSPNVVIERNAIAPGLVARFEVPDPVARPLTLLVVGPFGDGAAEVTAEMPLPF